MAVIVRTTLRLVCSNDFMTLCLVLGVFVPVAILYMRQPIKLDYL